VEQIQINYSLGHFFLGNLFTRWRRPCPWSFVGFGFTLALLTPSWARGMT
jgi:hypothetical protein